jgi:hypothetical protein
MRANPRLRLRAGCDQRSVPVGQGQQGPTRTLLRDLLFATNGSRDLVELLVVANVGEDYRHLANAGKTQVACRESDHETCLIPQQGSRACSPLRAVRGAPTQRAPAAPIAPQRSNARPCLSRLVRPAGRATQVCAENRAQTRSRNLRGSVRRALPLRKRGTSRRPSSGTGERRSTPGPAGGEREGARVRIHQTSRRFKLGPPIGPATTGCAYPRTRNRRASGLIDRSSGQSAHFSTDWEGCYGWRSETGR